MNFKQLVILFWTKRHLNWWTVKLTWSHCIFSKAESFWFKHSDLSKLNWCYLVFLGWSTPANENINLINVYDASFTVLYKTLHSWIRKPGGETELTSNTGSVDYIIRYVAVEIDKINSVTIRCIAASGWINTDIVMKVIIGRTCKLKPMWSYLTVLQLRLLSTERQEGYLNAEHLRWGLMPEIVFSYLRCKWHETEWLLYVLENFE